MIFAINYAAEHGKKLRRHRGGIWSDANWAKGREKFSERTVGAIVKRGYAKVVEFVVIGRIGERIPTVVELTKKALT